MFGVPVQNSHDVLVPEAFSLNNFVPEKFFGEAKYMSMNGPKILECDCLMKAFFVEHNYLKKLLL